MIASILRRFPHIAGDLLLCLCIILAFVIPAIFGGS